MHNNTLVIKYLFANRPTSVDAPNRVFHQYLHKVVPFTRVADGGFVCTSMSRPKLFKNYLIGGH